MATSLGKFAPRGGGYLPQEGHLPKYLEYLYQSDIRAASNPPWEEEEKAMDPPPAWVNQSSPEWLNLLEKLPNKFKKDWLLRFKLFPEAYKKEWTILDWFLSLKKLPEQNNI